MDVTNRFVLDFALAFARRRGRARVLDYGCGAGRLVEAGLAAGLDIAGADVYYRGSETRMEAAERGLLGSRIREMHNGILDYPAAWFDLVVNNQVLEHVADLSAALSEIHRVLKKDGAVLSLFPSRDVFREGHIGIPFSALVSPQLPDALLLHLDAAEPGPGHLEGAGADLPPMGDR